MSSLHISLLGPPRIELDGVVLEFKRRKALALLAYLAVTGERQPRNTLATLFWPEESQSRARKALRRDLSVLNLALKARWLDADRESVGLRPGFWLDVADFQQQLSECLESNHAQIQPLAQATTLYRDDFLAGFTLSDSPGFDDWQFFQTESLRQAFAAGLEQLVGILRDKDDYEASIPYARRWLALDPLHEPTHRQLMQLYAQTGQQSAALRQYQVCVETLDAELGVPPAAETTTFYDKIRTGKLATAASISRTPVSSCSHMSPRHNLPTQTTTFIGREADVADIKQLLLDESSCRLLNLIGPGGIGKTRLALAAAAQTLDAFPDGTTFVSLTPASEVEFIVPAIAEALRFTFYGQTNPKEQLLDYLRQKRLLLIVDNFEHLLDGVDLLSAILRYAPDVNVLATSRERLNLQEEWVYEVQGLAFPISTDKASTALSDYSAVALFTQRARQIATNFTPSRAEMADIVRICQLVEGMPLALELAAPWIRSLSCREIAEEIERSLDFLATTLHNAPERHRSLRVVFEQTWVRQSHAEQSVLMRLSVFRGGCTREAAEQVTSASLRVLSSLVDKALLRRTNLGRYELHELIRQFAETQLQTDPAALEQAQQRHYDYFIAFLEARTAGVKGHGQKVSLFEIQADMDNVRLVWRRAVTNRDAEAIDRSAECLFVFYLYSSGHYEGQIAFQQAAAAFIEGSNTAADVGLPDELVIRDNQENLVGFLLAVQAWFLSFTPGHQVLPDQVIARLLQAKPGNKRKEGIALAFLSWAINYQGRIADSRSYAELALTLASETGDLLGKWWSLIAFGDVHSQPAIAEQFLKRALAVCQKSGDLSARGHSYQLLGWVSVELGKYDAARQCFDQAIMVFEELGYTLGLGITFYRAGQLATALGDYAGAIQNYRQALAYHDEDRSAIQASFCRIDLGIAFRLQGDYHRAEQLLRETLATFQAMNYPRHVGACLLNLGSLAQAQGDLSQAEQLQREALEIWQQSGHHEARVADASRCLGHLMVATGQHRYTEARQLFRQALELAIKHLMAPIALDVCVGVGQLLALSEEMEQAIELALLAEQHEASTFETKENARQRLAELGDQLPPGGMQAAQGQGQMQNLWATAQALLATFTANEPTNG